ncbi:MAG TPA: hypothetical protein VHS31_02945 [Tepidisphaeraceae bacterium]|jgi:hypothetical protein|nr:hypothetical protein [Tepidisphaeraceae bacterium]
MPADKPSPIEPLDYARSSPPPTPLPRWARMIPARRTRRIIRLVYLTICAIGFIFVFRFALHYRQMIEDAMNPKMK